MLRPLNKNAPIIDEAALAVIRKGDMQALAMLYGHTNDPVQKVLIELIFEIKGWIFEEPEKDIA